MKGIILLFALVFIFFMLWVAIWKILEPKKSVGEILREMKNVFASNPPAQQTVALYPGFNPVYENCRVYYEHFGIAVFDCLSSIAKKCLLGVPSNSEKIYCAEINDRIKISKGQYVFYYEIPWEMSSYQNILNGTTQKVPVTNIEDLFTRNLGAYTKRVFTFQDIKAWDLGTYIRVGVYGVNEAPIYPAGGIII